VSGVAIFQRARRDFGAELASRGHHVVYHTNERNRCPGCGRAQWYVGRITAECGFCGTAVALAEINVGVPQSGAPAMPRARGARPAQEKRRHERVATPGRRLQLLIEDSPHSFAVENISAGGLMGNNPVGLAPGATLQVRVEGGLLVPAEVKWAEGDLMGRAFAAPVLPDPSQAG